MEWLIGKIASGVAGSVIGIFGDKIVQPFLNIWLKSKDVDLEKFKSADVSTTQLAVAVLDANVKHSDIKSKYALAILNWWPFRIILWTLLAVCTVRFALILIDSTWWWIFGCTINGKHVVGDVCSWSIPPIRGAYGNVEIQMLLFFIIAKPVDTAVSGAIDLVSKYLATPKR